jgi:hypothetical protein
LESPWVGRLRPSIGILPAAPVERTYPSDANPTRIAHHLHATSGRRPGPRTRYRWRRLRHDVVRKQPRDTGSRRRSSPARLEDHAQLLVVQAAAARRADRPAGWLALVLYALDQQRPPGARRRDARDNLARIAAVLAVSGDWRSGRRARPGRQTTAALLALAERTVQRHWRLLEGLGLAERESEGRLLDEAGRVAALLEESATSAQRRRWSDRSEWRLVFPGWVREICDEQLVPYVAAAQRLLADLGGPARWSDEPKAVDNAAGQLSGSGSVAPSTVLKVLETVPVRRGSSFWRCRAVDNGPGEPGNAEEPIGGATRHSPTAGGGSGRSGYAPETVVLARQVVAEGRLPFARGAEVHKVASVLRRLRGWTLGDVVAEAELRLYECRQQMLRRVDSPAGYLRWLLKHAVPQEPLAQITAALGGPGRRSAEAVDWAHRRAMQIDHAAARRGRWQAQDRTAVPAAESVGGRAARALVEREAQRSREAKLAAARRREELNERWRRV